MGTKLIDEPGDSNRGAKGTTLMGGHSGGTRIVGPEGSAGPASVGNIEPVVAWLVITGGPGKGASISLSYGMNIIGRGPGNRIELNFGDDQISQEDHFRIAYDSENREFHLVPGRGTNLVYLGNKPLLSPQQLSPLTDIRVGATSLRFVPFCTPDWDWSQTADNA